MDYELLVDESIEDGKSIVAELVRDGFDVTVAFWLKTGDEGLWFLYIGSTSVRAMSLADAYRVVYNVVRRIPNVRVSISDIKIVDADNPVAKHAVEIRDRHAARLSTRYKGKKLGDMDIEEAYIYPSTGGMTLSEVLQTVTGLMNRTGSLAPSLITLRDGTQFRAIPVGIQMNLPGPIDVEFRDLSGQSDRSIPVGDIVTIL
jgi:hypothetical protein